MKKIFFFRNSLTTILFLILPAVAFVGARVCGQPFNAFRHYSVVNGLSNNNVKVVYEDNQGFIWIGSSSGLQRFDGHSFLSYRNIPHDSLSLPHNVVLDICQDKKQRLWVVTQRGTCLFNQLSGSFTKVKVRNLNHDMSSVNSVTVSPGNQVWFTTHVPGLFYYDEFRKEIKPYKKSPRIEKVVSGITITDIIPDSSSNLWLVTRDKGLVYCNIKDDKIVAINALWASSISRIAPAHDGNLLVAASGKLYVFNTKNLSSTLVNLPEISNTNIDILCSLDSQSCIVGAHGKPLMVYNFKTSSFVPLCSEKSPGATRLFSIASNVCVDRKKNAWVCHPHKGISLLYTSVIPFSFSSMLNTSSITSMVQLSDTAMLVGTENDGLYAFSPQKGFFAHYPLPPLGIDQGRQYTVSSMSIDKPGLLWFIIDGHGLQSFDLAARSMLSMPLYLKRFNDDFGSLLRTIRVDSTHRVIAGGDNNFLAVVDPITNQVTERVLDTARVGANSVMAISNTRGGFFWLGGSSYLVRCNAQTLELGPYISIGSARSHDVDVLTLLSDSDSTLWIGTTHGAWVLNVNSEELIPRQVLSNYFFSKINAINSLAPGSLVFTLDHGVALLNTATMEYKYFGGAHGIEEEEFLVAPGAPVSANTLFIAGFTGITRLFIPAMKNIIPDSSIVTITNIKLSHKSIFNYLESSAFKQFSLLNDSISSLSVAYDNNAITINFSALQYQLPGSVLYRYKLQGVDTGWVYSDASSREALYSNLPKGHYVFVVQSTNSLGQWQHSAKKINIRVNAPFWKGGWFYLILFLFIAGLITLFYLQRLSNLTRIRTVLERQVEQRTRLLERQKSEIERQKAEIKEQRDVEAEQKNEIEHQKEKLFRQNEELEKSQAALEEVLVHRKAVLEEARVKAINYEKKLKLFKNEFFLLANAIPESVLLFNLESESFEFVNQAIFDLTGYTPAEFMEKPSLFKFIIADSYKDFFAEQRKKMAHGQVEPSFPLVIISKDGQSKNVVQQCMLLADDASAGYLLSIVSLAADSRGEVVNQGSSSHLLPPRTLPRPDLSNKDSLIEIASLLSQTSMSFDDKKAFLENVSSSNESLIHMIDDMIDFSKVESGFMELNISRCYINQLFVDIHKSFNSVLSSVYNSNVDVRLHLPVEDNSFSILTDAHRFKQIMMNLVGNALKFTSKGFVELGYEVGKRMNSGQESIVFFVKDSGDGISLDKQKNIFDHDFVSLNLANGKNVTRGIGLSLTKKLVELLDGTITFESQPGRGTTFFVELPALEEQNIKFEEIKIERISIDWSRKTFLIAEDEDTNFRFIQAALSKTKATLVRAHDGEEAIAILNQRRRDIDIILMDMQMPIMNGYEATKAIKKIEKNIPIIAQTAFAMAGQKIKCFEAGCDGYISKPYKAKDLIETISKHLLIS